MSSRRPRCRAPRLAPDIGGNAQSSDPLEEKLRHCPLTVDGAKVELSDVEGGVEFLIRVPTEDGQRELRRRVSHLEDFSRKAGKDTGVPHGKGKGGGFLRDCPIVTKGTRIEGSELEGGMRVKVVAVGGEAADLRAESRRRLSALFARPPTR